MLLHTSVALYQDSTPQDRSSSARRDTANSPLSEEDVSILGDDTKYDALGLEIGS